MHDAAIARVGDAVGLVLVVNDATSEEYARTLGENFIRLCKTLSGDNPGYSLKGRYDYLVTVFYPDGSVFVRGATVASSATMPWR